MAVTKPKSSICMEHLPTFTIDLSQKMFPVKFFRSSKKDPSWENHDAFFVDEKGVM